MGPDGKPCKTCTGFKAWAATQRKKAKAAGAGAAVAPSTAVARDPSGLRADCPADVDRLGRHTWTFLHTAAAYYPTDPPAHHRSSMLGLLNALPTLYPCSHCAQDLAIEMQRRPPRVESRGALERWLCEIHNDVNRKLGKADFDCDKVGERWREGWTDGRCDTVE